MAEPKPNPPAALANQPQYSSPSDAPPPSPVGPPATIRDVESLLDSLRWRIRAYVWVEGLAMALIWLGVTFWVALALDYLPVLVGASEMPWQARMVILLLVGSVLGWILYWYVLRRTFVKLTDESMALLVERRHQQLRDGLVTLVEMREHPDHQQAFNPEMLSAAEQETLRQIPQVNPNRVFNYQPLMLSLAGAGLAVLSIALFSGLASPDFRDVAFQRILALSPEPWPRQAAIEVFSVEYSQPRAGGIGTDVGKQRVAKEFGDSKTVKVPRGADVTLFVRADAKREATPDRCTVFYGAGSFGFASVDMPAGAATDEFREYTVSDNPFKQMLESISFDVLGYSSAERGTAWPISNRARDYRIEVVETPKISQALLDVKAPRYTGLLLERRPYAAGFTAPIDSQITLRVRTSKSIGKVLLWRESGGEDAAGESIAEIPVETIQPGRRFATELKDEDYDKADSDKVFEFRIDRLGATDALCYLVEDVDGVRSERQRLLLTAVPDEPPRIDVYFRGIGAAVTPNAQLPAAGKITDDYGIQRAWFEVTLAERDGKAVQQKTRLFPFDAKNGVEFPDSGGANIDLRLARQDDERPFKLKPGDKILVRAMAEDNHREPLASNEGTFEPLPNVTEGNSLPLEIVTEQELLRRLEVREVALRKQFEHVIDEMTVTRDSLERVRSDFFPPDEEPGGAEPEDAAEPEDERVAPEVLAERQRQLRLLRVQRAFSQAEKSGDETLGVADSFANLAGELVNNRVQNQDRVSRYRDEVAAPLVEIANKDLRDLREMLQELEKKLETPEAPQLAQDVRFKTDEVLLRMEEVKNKMLEFETYNELLDIVRSLIKDQEQLIDATKDERKRQVLGDFLD